MKKAAFKFQKTSLEISEIHFDDESNSSLHEKYREVSDTLYRKLTAAIKVKFTSPVDYPILIKKIAITGVDEFEVVLIQIRRGVPEIKNITLNVKDAWESQSDVEIFESSLIPPNLSHLYGQQNTALQKIIQDYENSILDAQKAFIQRHHAASSTATAQTAGVHSKANLIVNPDIKIATDTFDAINEHLNILVTSYQQGNHHHEIDTILNKIEVDAASFKTALAVFKEKFSAHLTMLQQIHSQIDLNKNTNAESFLDSREQIIAKAQEKINKANKKFGEQKSYNGIMNAINTVLKDLDMTDDDVGNTKHIKRLIMDGDAKVKALNTMLELLARTDEQLNNAFANNLIEKNDTYYGHFAIYNNYLKRIRTETIDVISNFNHAKKAMNTMNEKDQMEVIDNHLLALDEYVKKNNQLINSQPYINESLSIVLKQRQKNIFELLLSGIQTAFRSLVSKISGPRPLSDASQAISSKKLREYLPIIRDISHYDIDARLSDRQQSMMAQINRYISEYPAKIKNYNDLKTRIEILNQDILDARTTRDAGKAMSKFEELTNILRELAKIAQQEHKKGALKDTPLTKNDSITLPAKNKKSRQVFRKLAPLMASISPVKIKIKIANRIRRSAYYLNKLRKELKKNTSTILDAIIESEKRIAALIYINPENPAESKIKPNIPKEIIQQYDTEREMISLHLTELAKSYEFYDQSNINEKEQMSYSLRQIRNAYKILAKDVANLKSLETKLLHTSQPLYNSKEGTTIFGFEPPAQLRQRNQKYMSIKENSELLIDKSIRYLEQFSILFDNYKDTLPEKLQSESFASIIDDITARIGIAQGNFITIKNKYANLNGRKLAEHDKILMEFKAIEKTLASEFTQLKTIYEQTMKSIGKVIEADVKGEKALVQSAYKKMIKNKKLSKSHQTFVKQSLADLDKRITNNLKIYETQISHPDVQSNYKTLKSLSENYFELSALKGQLDNFQSPDRQDQISSTQFNKGSKPKASKMILNLIGLQFTKLANKFRNSRFNLKRLYHKKKHRDKKPHNFE